jgi:hypothetical protein
VAEHENLHSFTRSPRAISTTSSNSRRTRTYSDDTSKGDLHQTGTPDATSASAVWGAKIRSLGICRKIVLTPVLIAAAPCG